MVNYGVCPRSWKWTLEQFERHVLRPVRGPINQTAQGECAAVMESAVYLDKDVVIHIKFKRHGGAKHICRMGFFKCCFITLNVQYLHEFQ
jgi:hypothetical protein